HSRANVNERHHERRAVIRATIARQRGHAAVARHASNTPGTAALLKSSADGHRAATDTAVWRAATAVVQQPISARLAEGGSCTSSPAQCRKCAFLDDSRSQPLPLCLSPFSPTDF